MRRRLSLLLLLPVLSLSLACQRDRKVYAGDDPAQHSTPSDELQAELLRVDLQRKTISVRVDSGMEQTFRVNDRTAVSGLDQATVQSLTGKEGSEVTISWRDEGGPKVATNIDVTQVVTWKKSRHGIRKTSS